MKPQRISKNFHTIFKNKTWPFQNFFLVYTRGGVLEDVLGLKDVLEDTFWSPWPWLRSLKPSKIALSSAREQHYFWTVEISLENAKNLAENLQRPFFGFSSRDRLKKNFKFLKTFFFEITWKKILRTFFFSFFFWEHLRLCPWPQEGLSLASKLFCSLALASSLVSSTPPLVYNMTFVTLFPNIFKNDSYTYKLV